MSDEVKVLNYYVMGAGFNQTINNGIFQEYRVCLITDTKPVISGGEAIELKPKSSYDTLKKENEVLKKKLEKCMEQRDFRVECSEGNRLLKIAQLNQQLESIKE